jgi:hypothetical protein
MYCMIALKKRIDAFVKLGLFLSEQFATDSLCNTEMSDLFYKAESKNAWFTPESITKAFKGIAHILQQDDIEKWIQSYPFLLQNRQSKRVAVIMAGNIPMVGFHDAMTVLIAGNTIVAKLSSKDEVLLPWIFKQLCRIEPEFESYIRIESSILKDFDAVIATGSNNSSRYFDFYFKKYPSIIRKNRVSIAILTGEETTTDYEKLADDIFSYFGLGCRNVSKLFIPEDFDIVNVIAHFDSYSKVNAHNKYLNNYDYNKSIYLLNQDKHLDNGYALFKEDENIFSPIAVVFYEKYKEIRNLDGWLERNKANIQCVVSNSKIIKSNTILFGESQMPSIWDYADNVDTMSFLETLI